MNNCNCNKPKCEPSKCRTDGFVFRKVVIPSQLGDDVTGKDIPENGAMTNSFVTYEANGAQYIYDSFGVYTKFTGEAEVPVLSVNGKIGRVVLTTSDLENDSGYVTASYVSEAIGVEASERQRDDLALSGRIDTVSSDVAAETLARQNADTALGGRIDGVQSDLTAEATTRGNADTALQNSVNAIDTAINKDVITDLYVDPTTSTAVVELDATKTNIKTSTTATSSIPLPVASGTQAGVMNAATYNAIAQNTQDIANIKGEVVAISGLPASPTQAELTTAWLNESGEPALINGAGIYDVTNEKRWTYYSNDTTWHWLDAHGSVQVNQWTNTAAGIVKGSTSTGQIFAEADGTGSVNGWDTLSGQVSTNTSKLATIEQGAQVNVQANWTEADSTADSYIQNKPTLATVATTGDYDDLTNKPAVPTVVQTTGTSTTDVMSQAAASELIYPISQLDNVKKNICIGGGTAIYAADNIAIGRQSYITSGDENIAIGFHAQVAGFATNYSTAIGRYSNVSKDWGTAIGAGAQVPNQYSASLGDHSRTSRQYEVSIGSGKVGDAATYKERYLANVKDPVLAQDAATKNYVDTAVASAGATLLTYTQFNTLWSNA